MQAGRSSRARNARVNDGYEPAEPSAVTSSNNVVAHTCGSAPGPAGSTRRTRRTGPGHCGPAGPACARRSERGARSPLVTPRCRATAGDRPSLRAECLCFHVRLPCEHPERAPSTTSGSATGSIEGPAYWWWISVGGSQGWSLPLITSGYFQMSGGSSVGFADDLAAAFGTSTRSIHSRRGAPSAN